MSGVGRRLARLEERARHGLPRWADEDWPADDQLAEVGDKVSFHIAFDTVAVCTDREMDLLASAGVLEDVRGHVERMEPHLQERRDQWLFERRREFEPWREKVRRVQAEQRAYAEASRQGDRELLERNRASVGLPPLTVQQLAEWGLEDTAWKGEDASVSARQA